MSLFAAWGAVATVRRRPLAIAVAAMVLVAPVAGQAHHSAAMFDASKTVTLEGVVKQWEWTNPHSWLHLSVAGKDKAVDWSVEFGSPNNLYRQGLRPKSLNPGDKVTVVVAPLKDGSPGGQIRSMILPDGKPFKQGGI